MVSSPWSVLRTSGDAPERRGGHTALLVEQNLLVMGGTQHKGQAHTPQTCRCDAVGGEMKLFCGANPPSHTAQGQFVYFSLNPHVLDTQTLKWFRPRVSCPHGGAASASR